MNMKKLNIAEILKDCPSGMELDCIMYDNVSFVKVINGCDHDYPIVIKTKCGFSTKLTKYGQNLNIDDAKCVIFPKGKTTWEGFQRPFKDGDILAYNINSTKSTIFIYRYDNPRWNTSYFVALSGYRGSLLTDATGALNSYCTNVRFATEEEKQKLFDAIKENGYKWNAETKTLEKLPKFKAGDVLVSRTGNIVLCDHIDNKQVVHYHCVLDPFGHIMIKNDIGVGKSFHCTLATDTEKQRLFDRLKSAGYKYNPQTNKLEKLIVPKFKVGDRIKYRGGEIVYRVVHITEDSYILDNLCSIPISIEHMYNLVPNKFDITTLKPFESKVLVRSSMDGLWKPAVFGFRNGYNDNAFYIVGGSCWKQCIPYLNNEHLCGTTNDCDEYYKTWE